MGNAEPLLEKNIHPTVIVSGYLRALEDSLKLLDDVAAVHFSRDQRDYLTPVPPTELAAHELNESI